MDPQGMSVHDEGDQLAKTTRVVVFYGLGIPEGQEDGVAAHDLRLRGVGGYLILLVHP